MEAVHSIAKCESALTLSGRRWFSATEHRNERRNEDAHQNEGRRFEDVEISIAQRQKPNDEADLPARGERHELAARSCHKEQRKLIGEQQELRHTRAHE